MNSVLAFTIIMLIWTVSEFISKKTKSFLSSLLMASLIFLIGFMTNLFPKDLLTSSSLLALGTTIVGLVIVHIGTMISIAEFKQQWKTFLIGVSAIIGITAALILVAPLFESRNYAIAAIGAVTGGTVSIIIVQEAALALGLASVAVLPILISAFQGLVGFPLTAIILKKEAKRLQIEYRAGNFNVEKTEEPREEQKGKLPAAFQTTPGTLFVVGAIVLISMWVSNVTSGIVNTFIAALLFGIILRALGILNHNILEGIDAYSFMMLALLLVIFGPLSTVSIQDLIELLGPLMISLIIGVGGGILFAVVVGKILGYSIPMAIAVALTCLFGFPGTLILSQEAAKSVGKNEEETKFIEGQILPKMIVAGFSTVTITSVLVTSIVAGWMR
jgi:MFS family permease